MTRLGALGSTGGAAASTGLLAVNVNTASGNKSTTSATQADVDATNAFVTFDAPASGNVLVRVTLTGNIGNQNQNCFLGLREGTTNIINKFFAMQGEAATATTEPLIAWAAYVAGISAGTHTYKLAFAVNGGATFTVRAAANNPQIYEVWAAP